MRFAQTRLMELVQADSALAALPLGGGTAGMHSDMVERLRSDFRAAISSDKATLDAAMARLREKIAQEDFLKPLSIYSRAHLRKIDDVLARISNAQLSDDALQVAAAVESVLELLGRLETTVEQTAGRLETTVEQTAAGEKRIDANRST
jgi:hypothetical protein